MASNSSQILTLIEDAERRAGWCPCGAQLVVHGDEDGSLWLQCLDLVRKRGRISTFFALLMHERRSLISAAELTGEYDLEIASMPRVEIPSKRMEPRAA